MPHPSKGAVEKTNPSFILDRIGKMRIYTEQDILTQAMEIELRQNYYITFTYGKWQPHLPPARV
jgi:hypothetical protein